MSAVKLLDTIGVEEYLETEKTSSVKREYVHGRVFALAGTSDRHNRITINLIKALDDASQHRGCQLYAAELKVRTPDSRFYYPDLFVTCEKEDDPYVKEKPCLIVEILSPSTVGVDRREKAEAYLPIPTLTAYLMVDSRARRVEAFYRTPEGWWERVWEGEGEVPFGCLDASLSLDAIYTGL